MQEFLADLYNARDTQYARLLTLHNKGTYLLWLGLLVAAALILLWKSFLMEVFGSVQPLFLFLAGFGGGLLSRLLRVVRTDRLPTDYGAYWVPLFLSPVLGGLAALLGVLVVELGVGLKLLGEGVTGLLQPPSVYGLGVVLGFSERLFQGLSQGVEDRLLPPPGKGGGSPAPSPPAGGTPGGAGSTGGGPECPPPVGQGEGQGGDGNSLLSVPEEMPSRR
ncbi:hypothetical protein [Thermus altitudinis]|uniref:hypothetical protein n=1 Tax=Thermus altitudinis TaxID=2908145 RepID=UPI001FAA0FD1|nr:hypothetical protein [Thermus altitudinis]